MSNLPKSRAEIAKEHKLLKDAHVTTAPCVGRSGVVITLWADNGTRPIKRGTIARLDNCQAIELARDLIMMVKVNQEESG